MGSRKRHCSTPMSHSHLQGWVEVQIQSLSLSRGGREKDERHSTGHSSWESEEDLDQHKEDE